MADNVRWITLDKGTHVPVKPGQSEEEAIKEFVLTRLNSKKKKKKKSQRYRTISGDHYSRLRVMWSDYARGACKPVEREGIKYFDIDRSIYAVSGEYPEFKIVAAKKFRSATALTKYLEELKR